MRLWPLAIFFKIDFYTARGQLLAFPSHFFMVCDAAMIPPTNNNAPHLSHRPFLTKAPWAGYSAHEHMRDLALPRCPHARCKRLKQCVAAHEGLYCQRTHISHAEYCQSQPRVARPRDDEELGFRQERMLNAIEQRRERFNAMTARWKAGEFDGLYGKYKTSGVVLKPPPQIYVEL
jgi:hypothetical protein